MISILAMMSVILIGIINPTALVNRGKDARRKKDLARIKVAFEEYYNDKGCYPNQAKIDELGSPAVCDSVSIFAPWLAPWLCDPDGDPYEIVIDGSDINCPNVYRAYTTLDNTKDKDIPEGWGVTVWPYDTIDPPVNYGVSSLNVNWYRGIEPVECMDGSIWNGTCYYRNPGPALSSISGCSESANPGNCFWANSVSCPTNCCWNGQEGVCPP